VLCKNLYRKSEKATRSTRHTVDSSQRGRQLVTSKHQSRTAAAVITLTRSPRSPPLLKKCTRNWAENKVNNKAHTLFCSLHVQWAEQRVIVWICNRCSNQLLC